jgi:hypothetical protein
MAIAGLSRCAVDSTIQEYYQGLTDCSLDTTTAGVCSLTPRSGQHRLHFYGCDESHWTSTVPTSQANHKENLKKGRTYLQ